MIGFKVEADSAQVKDAVSLFKFVGGNTSNAIRIAINKAGPRVRSSTALPGGGASQRVRQQVRLKASYVNERLKFTRATSTNLTGRISAPSRGILLSAFATNLTNFYGQPRVKVKPDASPTLVEGHDDTLPNKPFFMVLKNSGVVGIAARRNTPGPRGGKIKVFYGPSLSQVFASVKDDLQPVAADEYQAQLLDAMRYILQKQFPPEG